MGHQEARKGEAVGNSPNRAAKKEAPPTPPGRLGWFSNLPSIESGLFPFPAETGLGPCSGPWKKIDVGGQGGWHPPTRGRSICVTLSTNSYASLIQKHPHRHTQANAWPDVQVPPVPAKVTHTTNPQRGQSKTWKGSCLHMLLPERPPQVHTGTRPERSSWASRAGPLPKGGSAGRRGSCRHWRRELLTVPGGRHWSVCGLGPQSKESSNNFLSKLK